MSHFHQQLHNRSPGICLRSLSPSFVVFHSFSWYFIGFLCVLNERRFQNPRSAHTNPCSTHSTGSKMFLNIKICSVVLLFDLQLASYKDSGLYISWSALAASYRISYLWWVVKSLFSNCYNRANNLSWISSQEVPSSTLPAILPVSQSLL